METKVWMVAGAAVASFVLGLAIKKFPKKTKKANAVVGEAGEALIAVAAAVVDGKITADELDTCVKEFADVIKAARKEKLQDG